MIHLAALLLFNPKFPGTGSGEKEKPQDDGSKDKNRERFKKIVTKNLINLSLYQGSFSFIAIVTSLIKKIIDDPIPAQILGYSADKVMALGMVSIMISLTIFIIGGVLENEWRV